MTAKEYLNQIYLLEAKYQAKIDQAKDMRLLAESVGAIRYDKDKVQTSPTNDGMINAVSRITAADKKASDGALQLFEVKTKIISEIIQIEDEKHMRLLCLKYVHHMKLSDIADKMHFTYQYTRELHAKALEEFERTYPYIKEL